MVGGNYTNWDNMDWVGGRGWEEWMGSCDFGDARGAWVYNMTLVSFIAISA